MSALEDDGESSNSEMVDPLEDDASESSKKEEWKKERAIQLGYEPQKEIVYNKILPYAGMVIIKDYFFYMPFILGDVDIESTKWFADIKANLGRAIALRELRPGVVTWVSRLNKYIRMYGLKFPKHDHIALIKLLMSFVTAEGNH